MSQPHGYLYEKPYFELDECPDCKYGVLTLFEGELCCRSCGLTLSVTKTPLLDLDQYEPVNIFSGQPEGTAGTPAMDLSITEDGRIAGAVWLEKKSR